MAKPRSACPGTESVPCAGALRPELLLRGRDIMPRSSARGLAPLRCPCEQNRAITRDRSSHRMEDGSCWPFTVVPSVPQASPSPR
eukprot:6213700-Pleurochrysis_carterae.AAC.1